MQVICMLCHLICFNCKLVCLRLHTSPQVLDLLILSTYQFIICLQFRFELNDKLPALFKRSLVTTTFGFLFDRHRFHLNILGLPLVKFSSLLL